MQASLDLVALHLFFCPGILALLLFGFPYAQQSWHYREVSVYSPAGMPIYPLKTLIPLAAFILLLQGVAEIVPLHHLPCATARGRSASTTSRRWRPRSWHEAADSPRIGSEMPSRGA